VQLPALPKLLCEPGSMTARLTLKILSWTVIVPVLAAVILAFTWGRSIGVVVQILVAGALAAAVLVAVNHAEVVAHRVGEPFGSLVLAIAVTIIEVGLIVTLMVGGGPGTASLARGTVFAAVMITCNGIVGLALFKWSALPPHDVQRRGDRHGPGHSDHVGHLELGTADLRPRSSRSGIHARAAGLCSYCLARPVRDVRPDADRSAPRLLPSLDVSR
jgi:Sodium/calcium exchanger protein